MTMRFPIWVRLLALMVGVAVIAGCGSDDPMVAEPPADPAEFSMTLNQELDDIIREMTTRVDDLIAEGRAEPIPAAEVRQRTRRIAADASQDLVERFDLAAQQAISYGPEVYTLKEREFLEGRTFLAVYSQQIRVESALEVPLGLEDPFAD